MDRVIIYPGQVPLETDLLQTNKFAMVALSKLAAAVLGTATLANGFSVVPTGPASLSVNVNPGEIYSLQNIDGTPYSSIAADTTHSIVKQGISLDVKNLACAAPGSVGQSINYLVQATYTDSDSGSIVLPYYNASNPAVAYSGPGGNGVAQNTLRQGLVTLQAKAGVAATTGSQVTPAPDAGYVGLYVVTVANGQTTITSGNISAYAGAPILTETLTQKISKATADAFYTPNLQSNGINIVTVTGSLAAAVGGGTVLINAAGATTQTLPAASAVPLGKRIEFLNINTGVGTVARAGSDTITTGSSSVTSVALGPGDTLTLESNGTTGWYAVDGSAQLSASTVFGGVISGNGWKRLPGGLILQWGIGNFNNGGTANTFPITFPNAVFSVTTGSNSGNPPTTLGVNPTTSGFTGYTGSAASSHYYMAIGN